MLALEIDHVWDKFPGVKAYPKYKAYFQDFTLEERQELQSRLDAFDAAAVDETVDEPNSEDRHQMVIDYLMSKGIRA